nr:hypothetical protein [Tanacetum cinerariifolium]
MAPKAPPRPSVSKPVSSTQPEPKSAPAKTQGKKRKLTTEISDKPSTAIKSRHGFVGDEEADMERALEESIKSMYDVPRGPLPPVVIREPKPGKYQPLPQVPRKGKEKVTEEQVAHDLLSLQKPKKKSPADQYIFQRRTSTPTGSFENDEYSPLYADLGQSDSEEEYKKVVPRADAGGQGEGQARPDPVAQAEGQAGPDTGAQDKGQAGSNPDEQPKGQARPDPGNAETSQPMPSPVVHVGSDREHMDLDVADVSPQPPHEQMDEGFIATANPKRLDSHGARLYTLEQLDIPHQVSKAVNEVVTDAVDWAMQAPLRNRFRDLLEADIKEILHQRMWETDSYKSHEDHMHLYEALEKSMNHDHSEELAKDLAKARKKKKKSPSRASRSFGASGSSQVPPPLPPPPSTNQEGPSKGSAAPSSSQTAASAEYQAWTMTGIRLRSSISLTPAVLQMEEDMAPDEQAQSSDDEDIGKPAWSIPSSDVPVLTNNWASALASNYSPPPEDSLLAQTGDIAMFMDCVDDPILRHNVSKPLPLGGPPGQVTIQSDFFFNKDLEYLRYGSKDSRPALSISKMKAAYYPDVGLEKMVPDQIWINEECKVKEFKINKMNPGLNTRFWTRKDVDRSKAFMFTFQKRLKTKRIFRNLESFVG